MNLRSKTFLLTSDYSSYELTISLRMGCGGRKYETHYHLYDLSKNPYPFSNYEFSNTAESWDKWFKGNLKSMIKNCKFIKLLRSNVIQNDAIHFFVTTFFRTFILRLTGG